MPVQILFLLYFCSTYVCVDVYGYTLRRCNIHTYLRAGTTRMLSWNMYFASSLLPLLDVVLWINGANMLFIKDRQPYLHCRETYWKFFAFRNYLRSSLIIYKYYSSYSIQCLCFYIRILDKLVPDINIVPDRYIFTHTLVNSKYLLCVILYPFENSYIKTIQQKHVMILVCQENSAFYISYLELALCSYLLCVISNVLVYQEHLIEQEDPI